MEGISEVTCMVIGVGAIGRPVAMQLAALGVRTIKLVDPGVVDESHITTSGYFQHQKGMPKVNAVADSIMDIDTDIIVHAFNREHGADLGASQYVFLCVDSDQVRSDIWSAFQSLPPEKQPGVVIDGRVPAELIRIVTIGIDDGDYYREVLLEDSHEDYFYDRKPVYVGVIAAGLMCAQLTSDMRGDKTDRDFVFNIRDNVVTTICFGDAGPSADEVEGQVAPAPYTGGPRLAEVDEAT
jgi:sulfur carrier protein ThiS adenylyltransferase